MPLADTCLAGLLINLVYNMLRFEQIVRLKLNTAA